MSTRYICDCDRAYHHHDQVVECANRNHGRLNRRQVCGVFFGSEALLPGMKPGTGLQKCCLLFQNHAGDHSAENPELDLTYEEDDFGRPVVVKKELG